MLSLFLWQFFGTCTYFSKQFDEGAQLARFFSTVRDLTRGLDLSFKAMPFGVRLEFGEWDDRPHFHWVLTGFPSDAVNRRTCRMLASAWRRHDGGFSKVEIFDPSKGGLDYITKALFPRPGNAVRIFSKFGTNGDQMFFSDAAKKAARELA